MYIPAYEYEEAVEDTVETGDEELVVAAVVYEYDLLSLLSQRSLLVLSI